MKMPRSGKPGRLRRHLSASGIVKTIRTCFERLEDPVPGRKPPLDDGLLSASAMFKLKYPSPLHFETDASGEQDQPGFAPQPQDAFRKRLNQDHIPEAFHEIVSEVESFLEPVIKGLSNNITWKPSGPWSRFILQLVTIQV